MKNIKENLLVISSGFPNKDGQYLAHTFVKGYVDEAKYFYKKVMVLVLLPYFPFYNKINKNIKLKNYTYDNVSVFYKKYFYLPFWPFIKIKGKIAFLFISNFINNYLNENFVIHAHFTSPAGVFAYYLSKKYKMDYILTVHEDHNWLKKEINSKNKFLINTWKKAKVIIRVNNLDNPKLKKFNKNVFTIPNGFNHRKFKLLNKEICKSKLGFSLNDKLIINIGFYNSQKNQKLLINAIYDLPDYLKKNLKCLIIGGGEKSKELHAHVTKLKMNDIILLLGQKKHDSLPLYLNASDIFCLSSNSEGNPTVMFEALGTGLPYVGTNVGGIPEIIKKKEYGFLCNPNDKIALSEIIKKGLEKEWDKESIIKYSKNFSWKNIFFKTKELY